MKRARIFLTLLLAVILLFTITACGEKPNTESEEEETTSSEAVVSEAADTEATEETEEGEQLTIGLVSIVGASQHCQAWIQGCLDVIEANGDEAIVLDGEIDALIQAQCFDDLVARKVDGIVVEVYDGVALVSAAKKAANAGILVASSDLPLPEDERDLVVSEVMSQNFEGGEMLGEKMCEDIGYEGEVILLFYPAEGSNVREAGMRAAIEKYPDVEIVATGDGNGVTDVANSVVQNLMQAHPDVKAIIATNDPAAMGAMSAYESAGKLDQVKIYGFDAVPEVCGFIKEGKFTASIRQNPYILGKTSTEDLYKAMAREDVGETLKWVPVDLVTIDNVSEFEEGYYSGE